MKDTNQNETPIHFEASSGCLLQRGFLFHTLQYLNHVKESMKDISESSVLSLSDLKPLRPEDRSATLFKGVSAAYQEVAGKKDDGEKLDEDDIMLVVLKTFTWEILGTIGLLVVCALFRIAFSVLIIYLLQAILDRTYNLAYAFCSILIVCWYLFQLMSQTGCYRAYLLSSHIKCAFSMLLYTKISKLTACVLNSSEMGKITNLLSNDLSVI